MKYADFPKVSIIVPIYGVEKFIEQCATSIFNQTYPNIEYIFVNDCTKDNSITILESLIKIHKIALNRIKIINHTINQGLATSRISGIKNCTGEYVYHLDSDDWLEPNTISLFVKRALNTNADMVVGNFYLFYNDNKEITQKVKIAPKKEYINNILARNRDYSWTLCNRLIKRDLQLKAIPIPGINMGEDFVTVPRLIHYSNKVVTLEDPTYHYRQSNVNSYTNVVSAKSIEDLINGIAILEKFFSNQNLLRDYEDSIRIGKMRIKFYFIITSDKRSINVVENIYPNITIKDASSKIEKFIFYLYQKKHYTLISILTNSGLKIKKLMRLLFYRK